MFGTSGIRGEVGDEVTAELALAVGRALPSEGYERVVVGRDIRESGTILVDALTAGVRECGGDVIEVGVAPTPTVARAVDWLEADAGVVVTASHNPAKDNGIKLWSPSGQAFDTERRAAITDRVENERYDLEDWTGLGDRSHHDGVLERHVETVVDSVGEVDGLEVVVDVGNGAGSVTADALLELGCEVRTLNAQQDGRFPGRPSEPNAETLTDLQQLVGATDADLGVAHDGDGDRMMAVDERGEFVPKDLLLALFAREAASDGDRVAAPVDTSLAVDDALAAVGASVTRTAVGDVYVAERATEPGVVFGGEPSGAWIWPDETLCPDGPLAACTLAAMVARDGPLGDAVDDLETYPIRRTSLEVENKTAVMDRIEATVRERELAIDALDGIRIDHGDGWTLVRPSGTEPVIRVTAEARDPERADALFEDTRALVADAADAE
ncbi:phosphoglucosamine mutase [Natronorubrum bangense]|uniref:Phosphoglucosamine mutase n=2 Tax=Natronorubrum bangense TaxID=61858 RepID=A0A4D6HPP4_9EURY|nr:phosphoglucosamine mutase [Natronorubrum bangense]ELY43101.1 phosphoglucosamine mutase [Natronorubrum bangense JCM 10635]QCC53203.1 phosphoglucosamine mutase [Natronorubrum bangense]QCC56104.1 phosphoglucosamine mutase [Natronorubrum bangense]